MLIYSVIIILEKCRQNTQMSQTDKVTGNVLEKGCFSTKNILEKCRFSPKNSSGKMLFLPKKTLNGLKFYFQLFIRTVDLTFWCWHAAICQNCCGFRSSYTCGCGEPYSDHGMIVEGLEEREARGHPVGVATPYQAMGGLTGFSSLAEGYMRLDPSGRGRYCQEGCSHTW